MYSRKICAQKGNPTLITYSFSTPVDDDPRAINTLLNTSEITPFTSPYHKELLKKSFLEWSNIINVDFEEKDVNYDVRVFQYKEWVHQNLGYANFVKTSAKHPYQLLAFSADYLKHSTENNNTAMLKFLFHHEIAHILQLIHLFELLKIQSKETETSFSITNYQTSYSYNDKPIIPVTPMYYEIDLLRECLGPRPIATSAEIIYDITATVPGTDKYYSLSMIPPSESTIILSANQTSEDVVLSTALYNFEKSNSRFNNAFITNHPYAKVTKVIGGYGNCEVYLNRYDNEVNIQNCKSAAIHTSLVRGGTDTIFGFHPSRDTIHIYYGNFVGSMKIERLPSQEITLAGIKFVAKFATQIQFTRDYPEYFLEDSRISRLILADVDPSEIQSYTLDHIKEPSDFDSLLSGENQKSYAAQQAAGTAIFLESVDIMKDCAIRLGHDALTACVSGALLTFIMSLTEDRLKKYGCNEKHIHVVNMVIQSLITFYHVSFIASTASAVTTCVFSEYLGCSRQNARLAGTVAALSIHGAEIFTPWGYVKAVNTAITSFAGGWCTLWAHKKFKAHQENVTHLERLENKI